MSLDKLSCIEYLWWEGNKALTEIWFDNHIGFQHHFAVGDKFLINNAWALQFYKKAWNEKNDKNSSVTK